MASHQNIFSYIFVLNTDLKKLKNVLLELFNTTDLEFRE